MATSRSHTSCTCDAKSYIGPALASFVAVTFYAQSLGTKYVLDAAALGRVREVLGAGGLVVYPTDTVYGLAADPFQAGAIERLYRAKARPSDLPLSIAVAEVAEVFRFGVTSPIAQAFCAKNLPGPFTVVLRATDAAPRPVVSKEGRIAMRIPAHPISRLLAKACGPITATSANRHGQPAPVTCPEARDRLGDGVDVYVDGGPTPLGGESTIVDLSGARPQILRQGVLARGA